MLASHCIIDGFLGEEVSGELLEFALAHEEGFEPSKIYNLDTGSGVSTADRSSFRFSEDWSRLRWTFQQAVEDRLDEIVTGSGSTGFQPDHFEIELVATRDGGHFTRHIDTRTQLKFAGSDRIVSAVYYFHRAPARFTGGEFVLHPLVGDQMKVIEPVHDRLVIFSSIAPHEVTQTVVPGDAFQDARFSVNCWLLRKRT